MYIGKFHKYAVAGICLVGMQNDHAAHIVKVASDALIKKGFKEIGRASCRERV